jgi:Mrp family chromosome partitioning ATPase
VDKDANVVITMTSRVTNLCATTGRCPASNIIAIASGKGGVGTYHRQLAVALATGAKVGW